MSDEVEEGLLGPEFVAPVEPSPASAPVPSSLEVFHTPFRPAHGFGTVAMVLLLDYLFYQGSGGLSYTITFALFPVIIAVFARKHLRVLPLLAFGGMFLPVALRCAWQYGPLVALAGLALLVVLPIALRLGCANIPDVLTSLPVSCIMGGFTWFYDLQRGVRRARGAIDGNKRAFPVETVAIPLLICLAFAGVFLLSNPIIQDTSQRWYDAFEGGLANIVELYAPNVLRIFFWGISIVFAGMLLRPAILRASENSGWHTEKVVPGSDQSGSALRYRTALNTLIAVNILFALYNSVDLYYLIVRDALPAGLNHSQYTHQGAFWLTVALAMTTVVVGWLFHGDLNFHEHRTTLLRLAGLWLAQNFVLASWVFLRVHMYVEYNGMTRMRIVAIAGTVLVIIGLVLVTVKAFRRLSLTWLVRKELGAFLIACLLLAVLPLDYLSWRYNGPDIMHSSPPRTSVQLTRQYISPEGLATLVDLLDHPDPIIAEGVAALMGKWYFGVGQRYAHGNVQLDRWTHYQLSTAWCARVFAAHEEKIIALVPDREWNVKIASLRDYTGPWI